MIEPKAERKIPLFTEFYAATMARLQESRRRRENETIRKSLATEERTIEMQEAVARARETKKFLDGDFWQEHLEPFLRSEAVLKPAILKDGDPAPSERCFDEYLIGSGQVRIMTKMLARFEEWIKKGEEAEKTLKAEAEKRALLRESSV